MRWGWAAAGAAGVLVVAPVVGFTVLAGDPSSPGLGGAARVCTPDQAGSGPPANAGLQGWTPTPGGNRAKQVANARVVVGRAPNGEAALIAGVVILVEANALNLASAAVPESTGFPNDGVTAGDHDSVGLFQQRGDGWGTVAERMNPARSADLFYAALLRVPGWERLDPGTAAQRVQRSAFPTRYADRLNEARALLAEAGGTPAGPAPGPVQSVSCDTGLFTQAAADQVPAPGAPAGPVVSPVNAKHSGWGSYPGHTGLDYAVPRNTPVVAYTGGTVTATRHMTTSYGVHVRVAHTDGRETLYAHLTAISVAVGQPVTPGQVLGFSGSTGRSTGPHLHFEIIVGGKPVNPEPYLP